MAANEIDEWQYVTFLEFSASYDSNFIKKIVYILLQSMTSQTLSPIAIVIQTAEEFIHVATQKLVENPLWMPCPDCKEYTNNIMWDHAQILKFPAFISHQQCLFAGSLNVFATLIQLDPDSCVLCFQDKFLGPRVFSGGHVS